jgi:hypothetical protein
MAFSDDEVELLVNLLKSRFDLKGNILINKNGQPFISLDADSKIKFRRITSQFSIPGMEYKLNF